MGAQVPKWRLQSEQTLMFGLLQPASVILQLNRLQTEIKAGETTNG